MTRLSLLFVLVLSLAASAPAGAAGPVPLRVTSISPTVAERGELVTIAGAGFGAGNLEVTVGGDRVELVAATGTKAHFRVPLLRAVGNVVVEARNPGGHAGRIGLRVRFDGRTAAVADTAGAVSVSVGSDGGTIGVGGMTLAIPAGAVPEGTEITATPLRLLEGSPFAAAPVGLKLEPSGLVLLQPATLTLPKPSGVGTLVGFGFNGDGTGFRLVPHRVAGETVELKVWHFSGAGVLRARLDELEAVLSYEPAPAHELAEQRIAAALVDAQVNGSDPGAAIAVALRNWRTSSVSQGLQIAGTETRLDFFELAFGEWLAWLAYLQEYRDTLAPVDSSFFDTASALDRAVATDSAVAVARRQLEGCLGPDLPRAALRNVIRVASAVNLAALPIEQETSGGERPLPSGPNLPSSCIDVQITAVEHAAAFARNRNNLFRVRAQVRFWSGDPSTTIPLRFRLAGIATETKSNGIFSLARRPSEVGTDELDLTVDLDTMDNDTVLRTIFERRQLSIPVRERLELQARRPGDGAFTDTPNTVAPGNTVTLRIRLAGDDTAGVLVTLSHDGDGSLPPTATTGPLGEALVIYSAPGAAEIELVTATITEGGITAGDAVVITTQVPVTVTVSPATITLTPGATQQFTATVTGTSNDAVTWSASGGTITSGGLYTAGSSFGDFAVTARTSTSPITIGGAAVTIVAPASVEGLYVGEYCQIASNTGEEFCVPQMQVSYQCSFASVIRSGQTCGWFASGGGLLAVPNLASFCQIETSGTSTGGFFVGSITWCRFGPLTDRQRSTRIEGTIGSGRLEFDVFWQDVFENPVHEVFRGTKFVLP